MLCDLLRRTGIAGAPESLFRPADIATYANEWGVTATDQSWGRAYIDAACRHGRAGTGCFGMRIMWRDMPGFLARLASNGISPLVVTYEELGDSPSGQLARVLEHLGVAISDVLQPGTAKLADDLNIEWSARFRGEGDVSA
jgi:LPS sulfotransferase NodH